MCWKLHCGACEQLQGACLSFRLRISLLSITTEWFGDFIGYTYDEAIKEDEKGERIKGKHKE